MGVEVTVLSKPLSHASVGLLGVPEVEVWAMVSLLVHVTVVPRATVNSSRSKLTTSDATGGMGVGVGVAIGVGVAVG